VRCSTDVIKTLWSMSLWLCWSKEHIRGRWSVTLHGSGYQTNSLRHDPTILSHRLQLSRATISVRSVSVSQYARHRQHTKLPIVITGRRYGRISMLSGNDRANGFPKLHRETSNLGLINTMELHTTVKRRTDYGLQLRRLIKG
jgi:hypothetical protein